MDVQTIKQKSEVIIEMYRKHALTLKVHKQWLERPERPGTCYYDYAPEDARVVETHRAAQATLAQSIIRARRELQRMCKNTKME